MIEAMKNVCVGLAFGPRISPSASPPGPLALAWALRPGHLALVRTGLASLQWSSVAWALLWLEELRRYIRLAWQWYPGQRLPLPIVPPLQQFLSPHLWLCCSFGLPSLFDPSTMPQRVPIVKPFRPSRDHELLLGRSGLHGQFIDGQWMVRQGANVRALRATDLANVWAPTLHVGIFIAPPHL